jgi:hypothetical protein
MAENQIPEPRSGVVLPSLGDMRRAGSPAEQIAAQDRAWEMLETYATPSGLIRTRISNEWLGEKDWRVQLVPQYVMWDAEWVEPLAATAILCGHLFLLGTVVQPGDLRPSAVWHVPADGDGIGRFFEAHYALFHMLFAADRSFAVHANDGDFAVYAGPEDFIREALHPDAIGPAATKAVKAAVEEEHGKGCMDGILAHYEPFMLD